MLSKLRSLLRALLHRSAFEREMDEELRFHLESRAADLVKAGVPAAEAARRARLEFGNPEAYQDRCRESRQVTYCARCHARVGGQSARPARISTSRMWTDQARW